jgi:hypothetical protein
LSWNRREFLSEFQVFICHKYGTDKLIPQVKIVIEKFIKKLMMQYESLHPKESEVIKPVASRQKRVENPTISFPMTI